MLVELGLVEQRYKAVLEGAASVTDVARLWGDAPLTAPPGVTTLARRL